MPLGIYLKLLLAYVSVPKSNTSGGLLLPLSGLKSEKSVIYGSHLKIWKKMFNCNLDA